MNYDKETLAKARHYYLTGEGEPMDFIKMIFPELAESEDEKIRKALMQNLKERFGTKGNMGEGLDMPDVLAWFEKQGEQKPAWSEEDEINRDLLYNALNQVYDMEHNKDLSTWINKRILLCSQQQWKPSDAQMASITCAVRKMKESACYDSELVSLLNDLKKLKG